MSLLTVQQKLKAKGFDPGPLDGMWGQRTSDALDRALAQAAGSGTASPPAAANASPLAWGAKVTAEFRTRVREVAAKLRVPADDLMACMAWESGRTFSPSVRNAAGSGATGLIQFMPATARSMGTTVENLAAMSAVEQLTWVERYFAPYVGKMRNLGDLYMAILWPAGVGKADDYVLWERASRPTTYRQNAGIDINKDCAITRGEALAKVNGLLAEGRQPGNLWSGA